MGIRTSCVRSEIPVPKVSSLQAGGLFAVVNVCALLQAVHELGSLQRSASVSLKTKSKERIQPLINTSLVRWGKLAKSGI